MISLKAPAKINWFLYVTGKRADGFHSIVSIFQSLSLYDFLSFQLSPKIELIDNTDIPVKDNLVFRAALLLQEECRIKEGATITLKKVIPSQAGLGGGSSDAACTFLGLNELWQCKLSKEELSMLSARLGSDIPFFIQGNFALVQGRGEVVTPLKVVCNYHLLLLKPHFSNSTASVYKKVKKYSSFANKEDEAGFIKLFLEALNSRDLALLRELMKNDLENAIKSDYPLIERVEKSFISTGAFTSMLSGSGSVVFGVYEDMQSMSSAKEKMKNEYPDCQLWQAETIR